MQKDECGYFTQKDPDAIEDFQIDWSLWLGTETIVTSEWMATAPLSISTSGLSSDSRRATALIGGGNEWRCYKVRNRVTTSGGRVNDQSFRLEMVQK